MNCQESIEQMEHIKNILHIIIRH